MTTLVATTMPNGFDFTFDIRNSSKYLVLDIYNFGRQGVFYGKKNIK